MRALSPWAARLRVTLECLSYVAVIAGIFFFFVQQKDAERARRIETALLFVSLENEPAYAEARARLTAPWREVDLARIMEAGPSEQGIARLKATVTRNVPDEAIEKVTEFYSSVVRCRNLGLCDGAIIDHFFQRNVSGFYCAYDVRLRRIGQRLNRPDYGDEIGAYAGSCG